MRNLSFVSFVSSVVIFSGGCHVKTQATSGVDASSCSLCHTSTLAHTKAVRTCTDCHGGSQLPAAELATFNQTKPHYGDALYQEAMDATHVHPKTGNDVFFPNAGLSGQRGACFNGAVDLDCNAGDPNGLGTVDDAVDSEYARDLNYVRFINPGDLRVAHASCGGGAPGAGNYGGCHAEEVSRTRRAMMATNASVVTAAFIGNRGAAESAPADPRGYVFALEGPLGADACFHTDTNQYDSDCLVAQRNYPNDEFSDADPQNQPGAFEAFPGTVKPVDGTNVGGVARTLPHGGFHPRLGGIGGNPVDGDAHDHLDPPDNLSNATQLGLADASALCPGGTPPATTVEPVDGALRGFRAYYPLWLPGSSKNFNAVAGSTLDPTVAAFDPFGRGHGSGCTGCHMLYDNDGQNHDDAAVQAAHRAPSTALVDGTNKFAQAMNVLQTPAQQRFYPSQHQLTTRIPTRQCGLCHTFVTRVDLAYQGISEVEEGDLLARAKPTAPQSGDITFTTPKGTRVRIYDNLERVEDSGQKDNAGNVIFRITTDARVVQQKQLLAAECQRRKLDCTYLFSADLNGNGELDADEPNLNGGELLLPDRVPRESSVDGRQARIVYGGANGSTRLEDIHLQKGMHCVDCHFYQDLHGDGNLYTNNWDAVEIECEDCHGYKQKRAFDVNAGKLLTSGASGGNDLMQARDDQGRPFFEVRKGSNGLEQLWQRSRVDPTLEWPVDQIADVDSSTPNGDPHSDKHIATGPRDVGKLECYSCHESWGENCLSCHYQQNYKKQQREVFLAGGTQPAKTDFQLFGMVRSPFILGIDGTVEQNRLSPFRSSMEAHVSVADCNGNTVLGNIVHANCRNGAPAAGPGGNNFMPHTVRTDALRGCESCHTVTDTNGHAVNNHILAQTMGLGTGRIDYLGDWLFVASSGDARASVLDVVDVKDESEIAGETGAKNSFPGFTVGNSNNMKAKLRGFSLNAGSGAPVDVAFLRSYNASLCTQEKPLNPDLALVAAGSAGLQIFDVSQPDLKSGSSAVAVATAAGNFVGVDTPGSDVSDPFVYLADAVSGFTTLDLTGLDLTSSEPIDPSRLHLTTGWPGNAPALGVRLSGNTALVAGGLAGLVTVDVSNPKQPQLLAAVPACTSGESAPCGRSVSRVAAEGTIAYLATSAGLVAVDISNPRQPKVLSATGSNSLEDVALSGHVAFLAAGAAGLQIADVTDPSEPVLLTAPNLTEADGSTLKTPITQAHGIVVGAVPTQTWVFVADGTNGVRGVNASTLFDPFRGRIGQPPAPIAQAHAALTLEARDPLTPRDTTVAVDQFPVLTFATQGSARALAHGSSLDRIGDEDGRRLRDSWNPGNGVLPRSKMDAMRATVIPLASLGN
jgi:hypothetical protein